MRGGVCARLVGSLWCVLIASWCPHCGTPLVRCRLALRSLAVSFERIPTQLCLSSLPTLASELTAALTRVLSYPVGKQDTTSWQDEAAIDTSSALVRLSSVTPFHDCTLS